MISDPIADLLTQIRNANQRKKKKLSVPYSKVKKEILAILLRKGYILDFRTENNKNSVIKKELLIFLKYKGSEKVITGLKRISKPGLRVYSEASELPKVLNGFGTAIISTPKGLMTDEEARKANVGGEVVAFIW